MENSEVQVNIQVLEAPIAYHWRMLAMVLFMGIGVLYLPTDAWMSGANAIAIAKGEDLAGFLIIFLVAGYAIITRRKLGFWAGVRQVGFASDGLVLYTDQARSFIDRKNVKRVVIREYNGKPVSLTVVICREIPMVLDCVQIPGEAYEQLMNLPGGYWTIKRRKRLLDPFSRKHMVCETMILACLGFAAGILMSWTWF